MDSGCAGSAFLPASAATIIPFPLTPSRFNPALVHENTRTTRHTAPLIPAAAGQLHPDRRSAPRLSCRVVTTQ